MAEKVAEETKTRNPLELCSWQRWEITQANHNFECDYKSFFTLISMKEGYHIRKYKRYIDDHSVSVLKSTKLDRNKRSATRSKPPSRFLSLLFPLNLKQWYQQRWVRLVKEKHFYKRRKQLYAITEVRWNSGPQMVMHCPKCKTVSLIADRQKNNK